MSVNEYDRKQVEAVLKKEFIPYCEYAGYLKTKVGKPELQTGYVSVGVGDHRFYVNWTPSCCGSLQIHSDKPVPQEIADLIYDVFIRSGCMVIFVMTPKPTKAIEVFPGLSVNGNNTWRDLTKRWSEGLSAEWDAYSVLMPNTGRTDTRVLSQIIPATGTSICRLTTSGAWFIYSLPQFIDPGCTATLEYFDAKDEPVCVTGIATNGQGTCKDRLVQRGMKLIHTSINPNTSRELYFLAWYNKKAKELKESANVTTLQPGEAEAAHDQATAAA